MTQPHIMHNAASDVEKDGRKGTSSVSKVEKQDTQLRVTSTSGLVPQQQDPISTHVTLSTNTQVTPSATTSTPISTPQTVSPITTPQVTFTTPVTPPNYTNDLGLDVPQPLTHSPPSTQSHPTTPHNPAQPRSARHSPQKYPLVEPRQHSSSGHARPHHSLASQSVSAVSPSQSFSPGNPHPATIQPPAQTSSPHTAFGSDSGLTQTSEFSRIQDEGSSDSSHSYDTASRRSSRSRRQLAGARNRIPNSVPSRRTKSYTRSQAHAEVNLESLKMTERIVWTRDCEKLFKNLAEIVSGQWYTLGEEMGLSHVKLNALKELSEDDLDATVEMMRYWVKHRHPTWCALEDCIKQLNFINYDLISTKINRYLQSRIVTRVEIVSQDNEWIADIMQEASENAIDYHFSYGLWTGERLRPIGLPAKYHHHQS